MSTEFEPYYAKHKNSDFNNWDVRGIKGEELPEIDPAELFAQECEQLRQDAIAKGYAEGMQGAQEEINEKKAALTKWIEFMQNPIQLIDDQLTQELIQTIIWISQYCIGVELSVNPDKLKSLVNEIKSELPSLRGNKILGMNPEDVNWLKTQFTDKEIPGIEAALSADPSLKRGDFYLKDEHSELDGRIQTRFITLFAKYLDKDNFITSILPQE